MRDRTEKRSDAADRFVDAPDWSSRPGLRAAKIASIANRFSGSSFESMLRDREFKRLSDGDVKALAEEFRRRAARARAEADGVKRQSSRWGSPPGR